MMDLTDRHCRYFLRQISNRMLLYTEMITAKALIHGDRERLLEFDACEHPVCLQLGGSNPQELALSAQWATLCGYDEINLNVGCPSDRVQAGEFGLCLMKKPGLVSDCIKAMKDATPLPVSIKTRIGYDEVDSYAHLSQFIAKQIEAEVDSITVHARKGWLKGLSPKENRTIPPLQYETVYRLKQDFPNTSLAINGGITTLEEIKFHLEKMDAVMLGRAAYYDAYLLAEVDSLFYGMNQAIPTRKAVIEKMLPYCEAEMSRGTPLRHITQHWLGLFFGTPDAKAWRRLVTAREVQLKNILDFIASSRLTPF